MPKRCALGCPFISGKTYHQFPHPVKNSDRFKAWVCIAGGKLDSQDEIELYRKKVVCDIHFTDKDKNRNNRLNCLAVPSLHLDGKSDEVGSSDKELVLPPEPVTEEDSCSMLRPTVTDKCRVTALEHNYGPLRENTRDGLSDHETSTQVPESELILDLSSESIQYLTDLSDHETSTQLPESELILDLPSTSYEILIGLSEYNTSTHVSPTSETILASPSPISKETFTFSGALDNTPAKISPIIKSNSQHLRNTIPAPRQTETVMCPAWIPNNNLKEHSYCAQDKTDFAKAGEPTYHQPTPPLIVNQLQTARKKVKHLQSEVIRLRKRNQIIKTRLINAKKNNKHNCLQKITQNMTAAAKVFTQMQFTQTQKRNGGRRFTLEGQKLCLSIYKSSPQCYDLLSKLFTLPSAKTLKRFRRKQFGIQPGLNNGLGKGPIQPGTF